MSSQYYPDCERERVESMRDGYIVVDLRDSIVDINKAVGTGRKNRKEVIGKT